MLRRRSLLSQYKLIQFNKLPTDTSTNMPGVKIYTDNTDQSKEENIKLYNDAQEWRRIYILNNGSDKSVHMIIDALVIDDETLDKYDEKYIYCIKFYDTCIKLNHLNSDFDILTIYNDGTTSELLPTPTTTI